MNLSGDFLDLKHGGSSTVGGGNIKKVVEKSDVIDFLMTIDAKYKKLRENGVGDKFIAMGEATLFGKAKKKDLWLFMQKYPDFIDYHNLNIGYYGKSALNQTRDLDLISDYLQKTGIDRSTLEKFINFADQRDTTLDQKKAFAEKNPDYKDFEYIYNERKYLPQLLEPGDFIQGPISMTRLVGQTSTGEYIDVIVCGDYHDILKSCVEPQHTISIIDYVKYLIDVNYKENINNKCGAGILDVFIEEGLRHKDIKKFKKEELFLNVGEDIEYSGSSYLLLLIKEFRKCFPKNDLEFCRGRYTRFHYTDVRRVYKQKIILNLLEDLFIRNDKESIEYAKTFSQFFVENLIKNAKRESDSTSDYIFFKGKILKQINSIKSTFIKNGLFSILERYRSNIFEANEIYKTIVNMIIQNSKDLTVLRENRDLNNKLILLMLKHLRLTGTLLDLYLIARMFKYPDTSRVLIYAGDSHSKNIINELVNVFYFKIISKASPDERSNYSVYGNEKYSQCLNIKNKKFNI